MLLTPPMTMMDFFKKSEGKWYSQRAVHHFDSSVDESGESNLIVTVLAKDDDRVINICKSQLVDPNLATGAANFMWQGCLKDEDETPNPDYGAILVDIPNPNNPYSGKFLRDRGYVEGNPVVGIYNFAEDGVLTIKTEYEKTQGEERCWFLTDDFRVRVSTVKMLNGVNLMAYSSERRCVSPSFIEELIEKTPKI